MVEPFANKLASLSASSLSTLFFGLPLACMVKIHVAYGVQYYVRRYSIVRTYVINATTKNK